MGMYDVFCCFPMSADELKDLPNQTIKSTKHRPLSPRSKLLGSGVLVPSNGSKVPRPSTKRPPPKTQKSNKAADKKSESILYPVPNSISEQDRLQSQHYLYRHIWGNNFSSPVKEILKTGARVLDVGCGPGTWSLETACLNQCSIFHGVDISSTFPTEIKPVNAFFYKANLITGLPFPDNYFDFVYMRDMTLAFTEQEWSESVLKELVRVLKPGGWVELTELGPQEWSGNSTKRLLDLWRSHLLSHDITSSITALLPSILSNQQSLKDIKHQCRQVPVGNWGELTGQLALENYVQLVRNIGPVLHIKGTYLDLVIEDFKKECESYRYEVTVHRWIARKTNEQSGS